MKSLTLIALLAATPSFAQNFTSAAEVKPILEATKSNWIAVRKWQGQDLLYFTHLEAWRCGLTGVSFKLNNGASQPYDLAPCDETAAQPNALPPSTLPYRAFALNSIKTVTVDIHYDDGTSSQIQTLREAIEIP